VTQGAVLVGLDGTGQQFAFATKATNSNWWITSGTGGATSTDSGVAVSTSYQTLKLTRVGSTFTAYIDGVQVYTTTSSGGVINSTPQVTITHLTGDPTYRVDYIGIVFDRATSSGATVIAAAPPHIEEGYAAITPGTGNTHEYLDVTFAQPFAGATGASGYKVYVEINCTDAGLIPGWKSVNKTTSGMRIEFTSDFNGEVRWEVK
jgi:hypothetical protein